MPVHIWDRDDGFLGALQQRHTFTAQQFLSEAGVIDIEAPYSAWRSLIANDLRHALVEVTGPKGERIMRGRWTGRGDDPEAPAAMTGSCADLLEELRLPSVPPEYYVTHHPVLDALRELLSMSGTDWVLGDTDRAADATVSANLAGMSCLEAVIELCEQSGNYWRHDGWNRTLDVFADPFPEIAAYLVCANPDDELPHGRGRVETLRPDVDTADVLMAVWPEGGSYRTTEGADVVLRPTGEEPLPSGFSFDSIGGQIVIANDAVEHGLVRVADFRRIQALSNVNLSASGFVESSTPGVITSETLRRPQDDFWSGGTLEVSDEEFAVGSHSGATIVGTWSQAFAETTRFAVRKTFPEDDAALEQARRDLVNAACGLLRERQEAAFEVEAGVSGLAGGLVKPGDTVRLECLGHVELHDALTGETSKYIWDDFRGNLVVVSVTTELRGTGLFHTFSLSDRLRLLPTTTGLREMRSLAPPPGRSGDVTTAGSVGALGGILGAGLIEGINLAHEPYVTIGAADLLTHKRALVAGAGIAIADSGPGFLVSVSCNWGAMPSTIKPDAAAAPGTGMKVAHIDHQHAIAAAAPASPSVSLAASTKGVASSFSVSDHAHQLSQAIIPTWTQLHIFSLGARVGDSIGGNYLDISTGGILTLAGTAKRVLTLRPDIDFGVVQAHGKPTSVTVGAFQGFSLPIYAADNEEVFIIQTVPGRWDEASDIVVHVLAVLGGAEDVGDYFKFQLSWNHLTVGNVVPVATHDVLVEQIVLAGRNAQYDAYWLSFTIDYDVDTPDDVAAHDLLGMRLRRIDATNPDVTNEIIVLDYHTEIVVDKMFHS